MPEDAGVGGCRWGALDRPGEGDMDHPALLQVPGKHRSLERGIRLADAEEHQHVDEGQRVAQREEPGPGETAGRSLGRHAPVKGR